MPLGTDPPNLNRNVASLSLRDIIELGAMATEALSNGATSDQTLLESGDFVDIGVLPQDDEELDEGAEPED